MGIALPQFLLSMEGTSGGILLLGIVGVGILLPLVIAVIYLSRSSKYTGNYVMHQTLYAYYHFMKPSLAPRYQILDFFIFLCTIISVGIMQSMNCTQVPRFVSLVCLLHFTSQSL